MVGRTRAGVERGDKIDAIVDVAEAAFAADGYGGATMAAIARGAGVAPNAIYWYFASKDHLFVAVGERIAERFVTDLTARGARPLVEQLLWALERLEEARGFVTALHERAERSAVAAQFHRSFHQLRGDLLMRALRDEGLAEPSLSLAADALIALGEGLYAHHEQPDQRAQVIDFAIRKLVPVGHAG
ncbi:MAG: TetR/AcrR family transcriptional regulator [Acidimicrobiales bacterium]